MRTPKHGVLSRVRDTDKTACLVSVGAVQKLEVTQRAMERTVFFLLY